MYEERDSAPIQLEDKKDWMYPLILAEAEGTGAEMENEMDISALLYLFIDCSGVSKLRGLSTPSTLVHDETVSCGVRAPTLFGDEAQSRLASEISS